jgi:hypothetical protein
MSRISKFILEELFKVVLFLVASVSRILHLSVCFIIMVCGCAADVHRLQSCLHNFTFVDWHLFRVSVLNTDKYRIQHLNCSVLHFNSLCLYSWCRVFTAQVLSRPVLYEFQWQEYDWLGSASEPWHPFCDTLVITGVAARWRGYQGNRRVFPVLIMRIFLSVT